MADIRQTGQFTGNYSTIEIKRPIAWTFQLLGKLSDLDKTVCFPDSGGAENYRIRNPLDLWKIEETALVYQFSIIWRKIHSKLDNLC